MQKWNSIMQYLYPIIVYTKKKIQFVFLKKNALLRKHEAEKKGNLVQKKGISAIDCVSSTVPNKSSKLYRNHDFYHTPQPSPITLLFELFDSKLFLKFFQVN